MSDRQLTIGVTSMNSNPWRISAAVVIGVAGCAVLAGQTKTVPPQPVADRLAPIAVPKPNFGTLTDKPATAKPTVPAGFTVSEYAELRAPRMMVYAPNGDLFVSSPAANNITVLRDADNDGVFESRSAFVEGPPPPGRGQPPAGRPGNAPAGARGAPRGGGAP